MVNKEIARQFNLLAGLMELHGENAFKTKAYANAYVTLRKWDTPLSDMSDEEISAIPGIGSSVASKIREYLDSGKIRLLEEYREKTPEGIQQLLEIRGLGPKKIRTIWDALSVESPAELLYACNENRLVKLPGFGLKTQEDLRKKVEYYLNSRNRYLYAHIEEDLNILHEKLIESFPNYRFAWAGPFATRTPVVDKIMCIVAPELPHDKLIASGLFTGTEIDGVLLFDERIQVHVQGTSSENFQGQWAAETLSQSLLEKVKTIAAGFSEQDIHITLGNAGFSGLPVEWYDLPEVECAQPEDWKDLIEERDLKGILHNHSTWSDGLHTLEEMAIHVRDAGYEYFAICDHSRSAGYANGLSVDRVVEQMAEIDSLNAKLAPFKIFKGIESDILSDGALDYDPDVLAKFDLIVASIHNNLRMDEEKATSRLIRAIENPCTNILGHPTGRLLLSRQGYPIDHKKVIDACAANGVAIELNANPLRLDIDYTWLTYCMEKSVYVAINPDAHSRGQIGYVRYGVYAARKGKLTREFCLNAMNLEAFSKWLQQKRT